MLTEHTSMLATCLAWTLSDRSKNRLDFAARGFSHKEDWRYAKSTEDRDANTVFAEQRIMRAKSTGASIWTM